MEELMNKIENLKNSMDKEEVIQRIKKLNKEVEKDEELLYLVNDYKNNPNEEKKMLIYSNELYKKYKESETDLNILIMSINNKLKEINNKRSCR